MPRRNKPARESRDPSPNLTASQRVELYIKEAMYHGLLKPRERIVEQELAKRIGCSRAPVREAIFRLAREGLIVTVPRRGVFIRDLSKETIKDIFQMRAKLEGLCVRNMRARMTPEVERELSASLEQLAAASAASDEERFIECDIKLHRTIWRASQCKEVYRTLNAIMIPFILLAARATGARVPMSKSVEHHRLYLETVLTTPVDEVELAVERYFGGIYNQLFAEAPRASEWEHGAATWLLDGSY